MANHKSAEKRARQTLVRTERNRFYKTRIKNLTKAVRVAVEAGVTAGWGKYVGFDGAVVGIDHFGESAPAGELFKEFGFTAENVAATAESVIK